MKTENLGLYERMYQDLKDIYHEEWGGEEALADHLPVLFAYAAQYGLGRRISLFPVQFEYDVVQKQWEAFQEESYGVSFLERKAMFEASSLGEIIGKMPPFFLTAPQLPILQSDPDIIASIHSRPYAAIPDEAWDVIKPPPAAQQYVDVLVRKLRKSLDSEYSGLQLQHYYGGSAVDALMQWDFLNPLSADDWGKSPEWETVLPHCKEWGREVSIVGRWGDNQRETGVLAAIAQNEEGFNKLVGLIHYEKSQESPLWQMIQVETAEGFDGTAQTLYAHLQDLAAKERCLVVADRYQHKEIDKDVLIWEDESDTYDYVNAIMDEYFAGYTSVFHCALEMSETFKSLALEQASSFFVKQWLSLPEKPDNGDDVRRFLEDQRNSQEYRGLVNEIDKMCEKLAKDPYLDEWLEDFHKALNGRYPTDEYYREVADILIEAQTRLETLLKSPMGMSQESPKRKP